MATLIFPARRVIQPAAFLFYENMTQVIDDLDNELYYQLDFARTVNDAPQCTLISKDSWDDLIINATGPTPSFGIISCTNNFLMANAISIFDTLATAAANNHFTVVAIQQSVNSSQIDAMLLDESYFQALLALQ